MIEALARVLSLMLGLLNSLVGLCALTTVVAAGSLAIGNGVGLVGGAVPAWALYGASAAALFLVLNAVYTRDAMLLRAWAIMLAFIAVVGAMVWTLGALGLAEPPAVMPSSDMGNVARNVSAFQRMLPAALGWVLIVMTMVFAITAARTKPSVLPDTSASGG